MRHLRGNRTEITEVSCKTSSIRSASPGNLREILILSPIPICQYGGIISYLGHFSLHRVLGKHSSRAWVSKEQSQLLLHIVLVINPSPQGSWNYLKDLRRKGPPVPLGVLTVSEVFLLLVYVAYSSTFH